MINAYILLSEQAYSTLVNTGELICDNKGAQAITCELEPYYQWMAEQMISKGITRPSGACYPLWAWTVFNNEVRGMPDYVIDGDEKGVLVTFRIDPEHILQSDFGLWSHAINNGFIPPYDEPNLEFNDQTRGKTMSLILMHGTCSCLTDDSEIVEYYAECQVDECPDCAIEILEVLIETPEQLSVDYPAFEEPLSFYRNDYTTCDREWGEMIEAGEIPYPKDECDHQVALDVTCSVRTSAFLPASTVSIKE